MSAAMIQIHYCRNDLERSDDINYRLRHIDRASVKRLEHDRREKGKSDRSSKE